MNVIPEGAKDVVNISLIDELNVEVGDSSLNLTVDMGILLSVILLDVIAIEYM